MASSCGMAWTLLAILKEHKAGISDLEPAPASDTLIIHLPLYSQLNFLLPVG